MFSSLWYTTQSWLIFKLKYHLFHRLRHLITLTDRTALREAQSLLSLITFLQQPDLLWHNEIFKKNTILGRWYWWVYFFFFIVVSLFLQFFKDVAPLFWGSPLSLFGQTIAAFIRPFLFLFFCTTEEMPF